MYGHSFFFWSSSVSLTPNGTPSEWRLRVQMQQPVKTRCGRALFFWGLGFRAVITWEDSRIRWKPAAVAAAWEPGEKERIQNMKGWVLDWKMGRLCLTFVCKEVNTSSMCVCVCAYVEGRPVSSRWTEDCNFMEQLSLRSVWKCECKSVIVSVNQFLCTWHLGQV